MNNTENTTPAKTDTPAQAERYRRTTFSLDAATEAALNEICSMLRGYGARGTYSDAIRYSVLNARRVISPGAFPR
jgi:hypothetical protein